MFSHSNPNWEQKSITILEHQIPLAVKAATIAGTGYVKNKVPVQTGNLKNSISHKMESKDTGIIGTPVEYAPYVEYGTSKQKAQPYMRPGAHELRRKMGRIIGTILKRGLGGLRG